MTTCWRHTLMTRLSSLFFNLSKMSWWANYLAQIPCFPISTISPGKLPKNPGEQHGIDVFPLKNELLQQHTTKLLFLRGLWCPLKTQESTEATSSLFTAKCQHKDVSHVKEFVFGAALRWPPPPSAICL